MKRTATMVCAVSGCARPHLARGVCRYHYYKAKSGKDIGVPLIRIFREYGTGSKDSLGYTTLYQQVRIERQRQRRKEKRCISV